MSGFKPPITGVSCRVSGPVIMQLLSKFFCRLFRQPGSFLGLAASLSLLAGVMLASLARGAEEARAPAPDSAGAAPEPEGGVIIQLPQSPPLAALPIGYIREMGEHPRAASRLDKQPNHAGTARATTDTQVRTAAGRADALAQYPGGMKWRNWLLVHGSTPADLAYVDAIKRAAGRFGATIVDVREYKDTSGGRRDDVGTIPPGKQASANAAFAANPDYQIIIVADEDQVFGPYMPYRGGADARPVAGTTGLTATTWSPGHEKWGATQAHNNFEKDFKRLMLPIDYQAYVAARAVGEAGTRNPDADFATVAAFIHGPELQLAPFKGIKQQFRPSDGQLP